MPTTNTNFSSLITAIDSKAQSLAQSTTDPKDLVFLGKAVEALNVPDTVSAIIAEGDTQVGNVNTAGTTQVASVNTAGTTQVAAVQAAAAGLSSISELTITVAGGKFVVDGTSQQALNLSPSVMYRFDVSDATNSGHPLKFSTTADGTHGSGTEFTTGVTVSGTAGTANAYVQIIVEQDSANLFYYCGNHAAMGGVAYASYNVLSTTPADGEVLTYSAASGAYVNTAASSGGGAMNRVATYGFTSQAGNQWYYSYQAPHIRTGGLQSNTFGGIGIAGNATNNHTAGVAWSWDTNPSTGAITVNQNPTNIWTNTNGNSISTCYFHHCYGTGAVTYGGNVGWTTSSHQFGYAQAYLNPSTKQWVHITVNSSGADHGYNATTISTPTDADTGWYLTGGYTQSSSTHNYRKQQFNAGSFPSNTNTNGGSNTSTSYPCSIVPNSSAYPMSGTALVSALEWQNTASQQRLRTTDNNGNTGDVPIPNFSALGEGYVMTNGNVFLYSSLYKYRFATYSSYTDMSTVAGSEPFPFTTSIVSQGRHVSGNTFIRLIAADKNTYGIALFTIDQTSGNVTITNSANIDATQNSQYLSTYAQPDVIFDGSGNPTHIQIVNHSSAYCLVSVFDWPF